MAKIVKLTAEQERDLVVFRDEARAIGARTGHDAECEHIGRDAIADAYREIGQKPPRLVLWAQSPMQALIMHRVLQRALPWDQLRDQLGDQLWGQLRDQLGDQLWGQLRDQVWDQLRGQLWDQLRDQLWDQLWGQLRDQLWGQLRGQLDDQLGDQLWGQLRDQLWGQLRDQLWDQLCGQLDDQLGGQLRDQLRDQLGGQLRDQLRDQLGDQLRDQLRDAWNQRWCLGQCEMYWLAWARFATRVGVRITDEQERRLALIERLSRSCFMVFSWSGCSILVQRPSVASFDARYRLHRVDGPALAWPDGYAVYAVQGIRLTLERGAAMACGKLTALQIRDEPNAEVRRVFVDAYNRGDTGRYLRDVGARVIHEDTVTIAGQDGSWSIDDDGLPVWCPSTNAARVRRRLLRIDQDGDEPFLAVEVANSTPEPDGTRKLYTFRCHPELRPLQVPGIRDALGDPQEMTCQNAIASTYGMYGHEYQLEVET